jgi:hypothetical protein
MYGIWCEVSGGVTGYRAAWMKCDGKRLEFATREEAEKEARTQRTAMMHRNSIANFSYTARELDR